ncbi:MAG: hypothetical protein Ct9H300mP25_06850 [Acidobacteriota bacterium]|nr:MAG: hypothetical protein Ct9H300mP25_06850 [Acidobacteriota bacterium]
MKMRHFLRGISINVLSFEAEQYARRFGVENDIGVLKFARPIGIYGPGDTGFFSKFFRLARGRIPLLGNGQVFYHLTFIDDLVDGLRRCGESAAARGTHIFACWKRIYDAQRADGLIAEELGASPHGGTSQSGQSGFSARYASLSVCLFKIKPTVVPSARRLFYQESCI